MALGGARKGAGRPKKKFDKQLFEELCEIQCTRGEIASLLKMGETTLVEKVYETYGNTYARVYKVFASKGKCSLRRAMYKKAMSGDTAMLKWLSANQLGMNDRAQAEKEERKVVMIQLDGEEMVKPKINEEDDSIEADWELIEEGDTDD